jgi:hypothetical protein
MSDNIAALPIPAFHRSVAEAIGTATNLERSGELGNIVMVSETSDGELVFISAGTGDSLTSAEALWLLERGRNFLLNRNQYEKVG